MATRPLISVVDDNESVRESLPDLLNEFGFDVPGLSGPDLQRELTLRRQEIPIVFITAHRDETVRPRLIAQGAVECLFKPLNETDLLLALNTALEVS